MFQSFIDNFNSTFVYPRIDKLMRASGEAMKAKARELCPVDTGQLRDSIGYVYVVETKTVKLYADKPYAPFLEYGYHSRGGRIIPPRPFLRPAMFAAAKVWGMNIELQFPGAAPKYHERIVNHAASRLGRARRITVGHGRYK